MSHPNEQFEEFLREFQPRRPHALPQPVWFGRLAAVAALVIAAGILLWSRAAVIVPKISVEQRTAANEPSPSLRPLTRLALQDPARLDVELTETSRRVLPSLRGTNSTLSVLANE